MKANNSKVGVIVAYDFDRRMKRIIERIEGLKNKNNSKKILEYHKVQVANGLAIPTQHKYLDRLYGIAQWFKNDFDKITKEEMIKAVDKYIANNPNIAEGTKETNKKVLKKFFQWLKNCEEGEYPDEVRWIKPNKNKGGHHKKPENMLNDEDIEKMVNAIEHPRDKAFLITLAESGCRIGEILNLTIKNIIFDDRGAYFLVDGKTGTRRVRVVNATPFLHAWLDYHPDKKNKDSPLWTSIGTMKNIAIKQERKEDLKKKYKLEWSSFLTYAAARNLILRAARKAGITKPTNPHNFRHSRATALGAGGINESIMNQVMGWAQGSKMAGVYIHMSGKQTDDALLPALYGMKVEEDKERHPKMFPIKCLNCGELSPYDAKRCSKCNNIIGVIPKEDLHEHKIILELEKNAKRTTQKIEEMSKEHELMKQKFRLIDSMIKVDDLVSMDNIQWKENSLPTTKRKS